MGCWQVTVTICQHIIIILYAILVSTRNLVTNRPRDNIFAPLPCLREKNGKRSSCPFLQNMRNSSETNFRKQRKYFLGLCVSQSIEYRRIQDGFERRATTHSSAGYIICLGWCLAFLTLFWPIQLEEWKLRKLGWNTSNSLRSKRFCAVREQRMTRLCSLLDGNACYAGYTSNCTVTTYLRSGWQQRCLVELKCSLEFPLGTVLDILSR